MEEQRENRVTKDQYDQTKSNGSNDPMIRSQMGPGRFMMKRWMSILDFMLRIIAAIGTAGSAVVMGTTGQIQTLSSLTQFMQFKAEYYDFPTFTFFVIANWVVCGYIIVSLPLSIFHVIRTTSISTTRIVLVIFDTVALGLVTAGASAAAATVYLAHKGNPKAVWLPICRQFNSFCHRVSLSLIGPFGASFIFILLIIASAFTIAKCS